MSRKPIIAGNWKMYTTPKQGLAHFQAISTQIEAEVAASSEVICFAPFTHIPSLQIDKTASSSPIHYGAQNCHQVKEGAYTGEISIETLMELGVQHVIVGHSERRQYFAETNQTCNEKVLALMAHQVMPIYCVGETLAERESEQYRDIIRTQVLEGLQGVALTDAATLTVAYEPVWAIGTGLTASPEQAQEVHELIRECLTEMFGLEMAQGMRILYGGSVKASNAQELFSMPDIDGGLIGGASLKVDEFLSIAKTMHTLVAVA